MIGDYLRSLKLETKMPPAETFPWYESVSAYPADLTCNAQYGKAVQKMASTSDTPDKAYRYRRLVLRWTEQREYVTEWPEGFNDRARALESVIIAAGFANGSRHGVDPESITFTVE